MKILITRIREQMGVSYNLIPKIEAQTNKNWKEHIQRNKIIGAIDFSNKEEDNYLPTLHDVLESIRVSGISIESEDKKLDEFKLEENEREIIHSFGLRDSESRGICDFTIRYSASSTKNQRIQSILGIKSDLRVLTKLCSSLTKRCGSYLIISPYESFYINKDKKYEEIWSENRIVFIEIEINTVANNV